jgi:cellulose synthase/poly-beta-1,6-N-acetylglucosamine synthase-like glycosyltransferase
MTTPRVTVLMSVHNGAAFLTEALDSILRQRFADLELVVVEDGSTDATPAILATYARADSRLRLATNEGNLGLTASLNKGLGLARGELVARQDADDVSEPERLARQVAYLDAHPEIGLVGTLAQSIDAAGRPLDHDHFPLALDNAAIQRSLLERNPICHGSVLFRRRLLDQVGFYDSTVGPVEDYDLWLRLAEVTELANLDARLYRYRLHHEAVTERRHPEVAACQAALLEKTLRRRYGEPDSRPEWSTVARAYLRAAIAGQAAPDGQRPAATPELLLRQALAIRPTLLRAAEPLDSLILDYATRRPVAERAPFIQALFATLLPAGPAMTRRRRRLLAAHHMKEVFQAARHGDYGRVADHLWPALGQNPAWLLNRGVLAIALRSLRR